VSRADDRQAVLAELERARRVLVVGHRDPDGDALGSTLGLMDLLAGRGKQVWGHSAGPIPPELVFLPGLDQVGDALPEPGELDLAVLLDCHEPKRAGKLAADYLPGLERVAVVDHHQGPVDFGDATWVDPQYAATSEMVAELALDQGWSISPAAATALFCGLQTDTGSFRYANASPRAFRVAAALVEAGADPWAVSQEVYATRPKRLMLLARILEGLELRLDGRLALGQVRLADLAELAADSRDMEDAVEALRGLPGVEAAALFRELERGGAKASLRSRGKVDVAQVAMALGGGGHKNAAGFTTDGELGPVREEVADMLATALEKA